MDHLHRKPRGGAQLLRVEQPALPNELEQVLPVREGGLMEPLRSMRNHCIGLGRPRAQDSAACDHFLVDRSLRR
jgi:hypothetical protein